MEKLIRILHTENYSCVVENFERIFTFNQQGVYDLYDMIKNKPCFLKDAYVADRVVGKASAALMILGCVQYVYAEVISLSALVMLREEGIRTDFGRLVPFIWNRDRSNCCSLEQICYHETSVQRIFVIVDEFISNKKELVDS